MRRLAMVFMAAGILFGQGERLIIGSTTKEQAIALFGKPTSAADYGSMSSLTWSSFSNGQLNVTALIFDDRGVLKAKNIIGNMPPLLPGAPVDANPNAPAGKDGQAPGNAPSVPGPKIRDLFCERAVADGPSCFIPVNVETVKAARDAAKGFKKTCEFVFIDDKNWPGQASKGFMTELLTGVSVKDPAVRFYFRTPFMAVRDAYILADHSYEDISDEAVLADYGGSNVFSIYADATGHDEKMMNALVGKAQVTTPGDPIKNLVLKLSDGTIVKPVARTGDTFSFPLNMVPPSTKGFTFVCISSRGLALELPIQMGTLHDKAVL